MRAQNRNQTVRQDEKTADSERKNGRKKKLEPCNTK
jgi:hypothetical protein